MSCTEMSCNNDQVASHYGQMESLSHSITWEDRACREFRIRVLHFFSPQIILHIIFFIRIILSIKRTKSLGTKHLSLYWVPRQKLVIPTWSLLRNKGGEIAHALMLTMSFYNLFKNWENKIKMISRPIQYKNIFT